MLNYKPTLRVVHLSRNLMVKIDLCKFLQEFPDLELIDLSQNQLSDLGTTTPTKHSLKK